MKWQELEFKSYNLIILKRNTQVRSRLMVPNFAAIWSIQRHPQQRWHFSTDPSNHRQISTTNTHSYQTSTNIMQYLTCSRATHRETHSKYLAFCSPYKLSITDSHWHAVGRLLRLFCRRRTALLLTWFEVISTGIANTDLLILLLGLSSPVPGAVGTDDNNRSPVLLLSVVQTIDASELQ